MYVILGATGNTGSVAARNCSTGQESRVVDATARNGAIGRPGARTLFQRMFSIRMRLSRRCGSGGGVRFDSAGDDFRISARMKIKCGVNRQGAEKAASRMR